MEVNSSTYGL